MRAVAGLLFALAMQQQKERPPLAVAHEMARLQACHPAFKLTPSPINMRVVWTQPFDLVWLQEDRTHLRIEFSIQYAQSDAFTTRAEAEHSEDFNPMFNLRQRSHYAVQDDHLRLLWRESLIGSHWKRQKKSTLELACWQTLPDRSSTEPQAHVSN